MILNLQQELVDLRRENNWLKERTASTLPRNEREQQLLKVARHIIKELEVN